MRSRSLLVRLSSSRPPRSQQSKRPASTLSLFPTSLSRVPLSSTGRPTVSVPVLSRTIASRCASRSSASPPLKSTPSCAPRPTATVSAAGTASPIAHGHAITSTATVLASASGSECAAIQPRRKRHCRQPQHHRHKDRAGAVGQPLHRRARALRLVHHARNLRQHRGLAQRLRPANHCAVVVQRSGQHAPAGLALQRRRFAGQHRLIHRRAAFNNRRVHRKALAGQDHDAVARPHLFERHHRLHAVHDAARGHRPQPRERVQRSQRAPLGARLPGSCPAAEIRGSAEPRRSRPAARAQARSWQKPNRRRPPPCPGSPACSCWWRRGAARGSRSRKSRAPPTPPPPPSSTAETSAVRPPAAHRATAAARISRRSDARPSRPIPSGMASSMAAAPAASVTHAFQADSRQRILGVRAPLARARQHRIVSRPANRLHQLLRRGQRGIEDHAGAMRHQIHARRLHARRRAQRLFHVVLAEAHVIPRTGSVSDSVVCEATGQSDLLHPI